jgi:predicted short-subunit dehydrogenase-like oxidoreductase (DUF2520 family)
MADLQIPSQMTQSTKPLRRVAFIGAGNLATRLALAMQERGFEVMQVWSRTAQSAEVLASLLGCGATTTLADLTPEADLYVFAVSDKALPALLEAMPHRCGLWVHTAGSVGLSVFEACGMARCGVFYPLQTFSKARKPDFARIPIFIEARSAGDLELLREAGLRLSGSVSEATSEQRRQLHLAAVFACNFTNHMYAVAAQLVERSGLPFDALRPLIAETAAKINELTPREAQTGPAIRFDTAVIERHERLLADEPRLQELYHLLSLSIHDFANNQ